MPDQTPALDDFRRAYEADDNEWWLLDCGHHMNLFDEAIDRIDEARDWATWFAAERDELARQRAFELEAIAERQRMYRDRIAAEEQRAGEMARLAIAEQESAAALRAHIAELEAAQANPDAYIAVKRCGDFPNADRPDWFADARVLHPGAPHFEADRAEYVRNGFDLLPIVGTETGTRPATPQPDPAGYVVVTRNSEGGVHRSATAWDDLERATAAGDFQARHAEGTGCSAAVYELLREVQQ